MYGLSFLYENRGYLARPWCLNAGGPPKKLYSIEHIKKFSLNRRISRPYIAKFFIFRPIWPFAPPID